MAYIEVSHLTKEFRIPRTGHGIGGMVRSLFHREYEHRMAVRDLSLSIGRGEVVGYIGPNGAGKSTTIKMLCGILTPSSGAVTVGGLVPYRERVRNSRQIGVVFGQRSQLYWDLPIVDTFDLYQKLYEVPAKRFEENKRFFIELFGMEAFIHQPVRQLSLGQKMKANLAIAMLHDPDILYLDEPTIGLDVMTKRDLRACIARMNQERQTTIMLTTHDMSDIEAVCHRLILIDHGEKLFDGSLRSFKEQYDSGYSVKLEFDCFPEWVEDARFSPPETDQNCWVVRPREGLTPREALLTLAERYSSSNISVTEPKIEDMIDSLFRK